MIYIVAADLSGPAISKAANYLYRATPGAVLVDMNQVDAWPGATPGCRLFLVDHGDGTRFGDHRDPRELRADANIGPVYRMASEIVLVSCGDGATSEGEFYEAVSGGQCAAGAQRHRGERSPQALQQAIVPEAGPGRGRK